MSLFQTAALKRFLAFGFSQLFWRTFLLIALLIIVSLTAWFQSFRVIEREPRAQRLSQQLVSIVKLTRTALIYSDQDLRRALLQDLENNEGVRVFPRLKNDYYKAQAPAPINDLVASNLRQRLGLNTVISDSVNGISGIWISFKIDNDSYWVLLNREQIENINGLQWLGWGIFALALSLFGAAFITRLVNQPFVQLSQAARQISLGQAPRPLPESGMAVATETNRSFNQMVHDLEQLETDRAFMLASISHDLRTPLTRMRLEIEIAALKKETKDAMIEDIEQINGILHRFMDYARPALSDTKKINVSDILEEACSRLKNDKNIWIELHLQKNIFINADPLDIRRIIDNLLQNASKYGKNSEGIVVININTFIHSKHAQISIADHGPGIDEAHIALVTRPFYRVDKARSQAQGTGLGLAIVQRLISRYQGTLIIKNRQSETGSESGLEVILSFPLVQSEA